MPFLRHLLSKCKQWNRLLFVRAMFRTVNRHAMTGRHVSLSVCGRSSYMSRPPLTPQTCPVM